MRVVQVLTQQVGGPVDHAVDVACVLAGRGVDSQVLGPVGPATARARAAGVTWHDVRVDGKGDAAGAARASRLLASLRPSATHLQDRRAGWLGRLLAPRLGGGLVYTLHGVPDGLSDLVAGNALAGRRRRRDRLYYLHGERWVTRWSGGRVVVPSHAVAAYAERLVRVPAERVDVVHNGVDTDRFHPGRPRAEHRMPTAIWAGVLGPVKRPLDLLDATRRVEGLRLRVVGDGPLAEEVAARRTELGLTDRVELLGARSDVDALLPGADVFVLTSAAENLPLAMLQAMACGLPVVATAVGGIPEVVRDGRDGILVPVGDQDALAAALRRLVHEPATRLAMGCSARSRVRDDFGLDRCVDGLLASYERSAAERSRIGRPLAARGAA